MEINARESLIKTRCRGRRWGRSFGSDADGDVLPGDARNDRYWCARRAEAKREESERIQNPVNPTSAPPRRRFSGSRPDFRLSI